MTTLNEVVRALVKPLARWRRKSRPYDNFEDGSSLTEINREAIRYRSKDGRYVDVGFYADVSRSYLWVIKKSTLAEWTWPSGIQLSDAEIEGIIARLVEYCDARNLRFTTE